MKLLVSIEKNGQWTNVGSIVGNDYQDAVFCYSPEYVTDEEAIPISIHLPLQKTTFAPTSTRNFFEGLLPEGFTRRSVASYLHVDEGDYIQILRVLGKECIGAIKVYNAEDPVTENSYEKLSLSDIKSLASEGITKSSEYILDSHISLAGASGKVGLLYYNNEWYLPKGTAPSNYIIKQSHVRLNNIVLNEQFCQLVAGRLGIDIPQSTIINTGTGKENEVLFASSRFDRIMGPDANTINGIPVPYRLHQEDFAQALGIPATLKYEREPSEHYLKKMFDLLRMHSRNPIEDQLKLWDLLIVNFLLGNTDCHLKNVSLIYSPNLKSVSLAPCYDIISTVIYGDRISKMSLSIDGQYETKAINRKSFENEAVALQLGKKNAMQHFDSIADKFANAVNDVAEELRNAGFSDINSIKEKVLVNSQQCLR